MDIRKLQRAIVDGLEDVKALNIAVFNTEHLSPLFERVIIASGNSNRQTKALASSVRESVKSRGLQVLRTEGEENGEWIIVDCGAAVCHVMQPAIRDYYRLEEIWGEKAVRLKTAAPKGRALAESERVQTASGKAAASKPRGATRVSGGVVKPQPGAGKGATAKTVGSRAASAKPATGAADAAKPKARRAGPGAARRPRGPAAEAVRTVVVPAPRKVAAKSAASGTARAPAKAAKSAKRSAAKPAAPAKRSSTR